MLPDSFPSLSHVPGSGFRIVIIDVIEFPSKLLQKVLVDVTMAASDVVRVSFESVFVPC